MVSTVIAAFIYLRIIVARMSDDDDEAPAAGRAAVVRSRHRRRSRFRQSPSACSRNGC